MMTNPAVTDDYDDELAALEADASRCEEARTVYEKIRRRRDSRLRTLREAGVPVESLSERAKLSHQRISQILKRPN